MSTQSVNPAFKVFQDIDGQPLENGYIYLGTAGLNPVNNPIPAFWDVNLTIPAAQPIRTRSGFPLNNNAIAMMYVDANDFSISVNNKNNVNIYTALNQTERYLFDLIRVIDYGVVGNGIADDTEAFQRALDAASGKILLVGEGIYNITSELKADNVLIINENSKIIGTGTFRGVLLNETIPYNLFNVPFNISLSKNRNTEDQANLVLDPCLGDDANSGVNGLPVATIAVLRTRLNELINIGDDNNISVIIRDGRVEIDSAVDFDLSQVSSKITIRNNSGESPYISGKLKWFFRDGDTALNNGSVDVYSLFCVDNDFNFIPPTTTSVDFDSRSLNRNQVQAITEASDICTLVVDADVKVSIDASSNLTRCRLHVTQSFTSSLYHGISLASTNMTYTKPASQSSLYFNGFDSGVPDGFAPYFIEGLNSPSLKSHFNWCNNGTTISLPNKGNIFISPIEIDTPLTVSGNKYVIKGLPLMYHSPTTSSLEENYTSTLNSSNSFLILNGDDCEYIEGSLKYVEGGGIYADGNNVKITDNLDNTWIGHTCFFHGLDTNPESITGGDILRNKGTFWGTNNAGGQFIQGASADLEIKDNIMFDGATTGIRVQADQTTSITIQCFRNVIYNVGLVGGRPHERFKVSDAGGYYFNSINVACNHQCNQNVVFNVDGYTDIRGFYIDNQGINGTYNQNLGFNIKGRVFDNRNVSGLTDGNSYNQNIFFGSVRASDNTTGTFFKNVIVGQGGLGTNEFGGGLTITDPVSGLKPTGTTMPDYAQLRDLDSYVSDGIDTSNIRPISSYLTDRITTREYYEGSFTPILKGSSTPGSPTQTVSIGEYKVDGDYVEFSLRVTWSAIGGATGNIEIDLNDIPYSARSQASMIWPCFFWENIGGVNYTYVGQNSKVVTIEPAIDITTQTSGSFAIQGKFLFT